MKNYEVKPENKQTRNIGVYADDLRDFDKAADATERSRARMFRWIVSEWRSGRAVFAPIGKPHFKRQEIAKNGKLDR